MIDKDSSFYTFVNVTQGEHWDGTDWATSSKLYKTLQYYCFVNAFINK